MAESLNIPHATLAEVAKTYCSAEAPLKTLAMKYGINYATLKGYSSRLGWPAKRQESLARAVNPEGIQDVRSDAERLFHHQVRFQQEAPDELRRTRLKCLSLARKAEKKGDLKTAGYLLEAHSKICRVAKNALGIDLAEDLRRSGAAGPRERHEEPIHEITAGLEAPG